jgi:hypothetical protein
MVLLNERLWHDRRRLVAKLDAIDNKIEELLGEQE